MGVTHRIRSNRRIISISSILSAIVLLSFSLRVVLLPKRSPGVVSISGMGGGLPLH